LINSVQTVPKTAFRKKEGNSHTNGGRDSAPYRTTPP
jgi:hypothetical protein